MSKLDMFNRKLGEKILNNCSGILAWLSGLL